MNPSPAQPLTHDMRKAAEAAYQGRPLDPLWTQQAQSVYYGIWNATHRHFSTRPARPTPSASTTRGTHYSQATPLLTKPVQAWHISYADSKEHTLMLFPAHADVSFILAMIKELSAGRRFRTQPLKHGHFHIQYPGANTVNSLYLLDSRTIDQDGHVHLRPLRSPTPPTHQ